MKKAITILLVLLLLLSLAACDNSNDSGSRSIGDTSEKTTESERESQMESSFISSDESSDPRVSAASEEGSKTLVAYFSLAGEQYDVGVIEEGNTRIIADLIAVKTGADVFEIEAVTPYPETYSGLLDISRQEMTDSARPEIAGTVENMNDYDVVFIGYPNWWGDMPMIVYNFVESYDFSGKTIIPFCTHGGSGLSDTVRTIAEICTDSTTLDGFAISGETAQNNRDEAERSVAQWLREGGYAE